MPNARPTVDIVTVAHTDRYMELAAALEGAIKKYHPRDAAWTFTIVDNRVINRGFARGCNTGAAGGAGPIIGLINPDVDVHGQFLDLVRETLVGDIVITGSAFDKKPSEYRSIWGCDEWVCGACCFITRPWWERLRGFDEAYVFGFDETDFIRRTQEEGGRVRPLPFPVDHRSPDDDTEQISEYKRYHFDEGARRFYRRWGTGMKRRSG